MAQQRFGLTLHGGDNITLGAPWPKFQQEYSANSFIGKAAATRKAALAVAQRIHGINTELELAKAGRREARVPEITARAHQAKADRARLVALRKEFDSVEADVFNMQVALQPYDPEPNITAAIVHSELRGKLYNAPDDKARNELLQIPAFRKAMFETVPEASKVSPMVYTRLRQADIERRYPIESATLKDWAAAESVVDQTLRATETALGLELVATGVTAQEQQPAAEPVPQEAWA